MNIPPALVPQTLTAAEAEELKKLLDSSAGAPVEGRAVPVYGRRNLAQEAWDRSVKIKAEGWAGDEVWDMLSDAERAKLIEAATIVARKEMALDGVV